MGELGNLGHFNPKIREEIEKQFQKIQVESGIQSDEDYEKELEEMLGLSFEEMEKEINKSLMTKTIKVELVHENAVFPKYVYPSDSGFDLHATEEVIIGPFGRALVPTGLKVSFDEGYEIQVRPKSGLAIKQGLTVLNTPGTVDCFSKDMKILTIDGEKTIEELKINDVVYSFNEKTLEIEKDVIVNIFDTNEQEIIIFDTDNGFLEVTPNSEVYTKNGLKLAKDIKETDEIIVFF
jgi:dUTP pyrophosphatase